MLPKHERRRLAEIEQQLHADDPEFARTLTQTGLTTRLIAWLSVRHVLMTVAILTATISLVLGEGAGFVLAGILAVLLITFRKWSLRSE